MTIKNRIGKRFREITIHKDTVRLDYSDQLVENRPIHSTNFANCNGVVLLNHTWIGMSHYDLRSRKPENYVPQLIEDLLRHTDMDSLSAVLIGGDTDHFERNKTIIRDHRIPIIGEYLDNWNDYRKDSPPKETKKAPKHLVAIPDTQEVIMYSCLPGYVKLA